MSAVQYPESFPLKNITTIIDLVRGGEIQTNLDKFAYNVWVVQGFAQKALLGMPSENDVPVDVPSDGPGFTLMSAPADVDDEAALQALEALVSDSPTAQAEIPWEIILPFLLKLLEQWLSKRG